GLSEKIVVEIHHSIAFFSPLGMLKIYSGVQIIIPSDCSMYFLNSIICLGGLFAESSGSKCGKVFKLLNIVKLKSSLVKLEIFSTSLWFAEFELALPIIANIFFLPVIKFCQ